MAGSAIEFRSVKKSYGTHDVVRTLDLSVSPGEFLVLLGPSGCGKSTILKMLAGIEEPSEGEIYVDGQLVNYALPRDRNVAMVFQNYALYPHMTVAENIAYPLKASGRRLSPGESRTKVEEAAELVRISDQLPKHPDALSGGQRQRVALARALVREPAVFLMDEPLSNLDAQLRDAMRHQLIELHRRIGKATIYVTHDQLEAMTMADRIIVLNQGIIQQIGSPRDIYHSPANLFVAEFIGHPKMRFVPGVSSGGNKVRVGSVELTANSSTGTEGQALTVGLRPSDLRLDSRGENLIAGRVVSSEFTGADTYLTLASNAGETQLCVRSANANPPETGASLSVSVAPQDVHIFDADGRRM